MKATQKQDKAFKDRCVRRYNELHYWRRMYLARLDEDGEDPAFDTIMKDALLDAVLWGIATLHARIDLLAPLNKDIGFDGPKGPME